MFSPCPADRLRRWGRWDRARPCHLGNLLHSEEAPSPQSAPMPGAHAITSLTVNPSIFFGGDPKSVARSSRLTDLTVFFPVNNLDRDEDGDIDYFGFRLRVNFTGVSAGGQVWDKATAEFESLLRSETRAAAALLKSFASMTEATMRECAVAIQSESAPQTIEALCGALFVPPVAEDYKALRAELDRVRIEADSRYFGLDVRLDSGDPTLGAVENAESHSNNWGTCLRQAVRREGPRPSRSVSGNSRSGWGALHGVA